MKTEYEKEIDSRFAHERSKDADRLVASERVFSILKRLYNPPSLVANMKLNSFNGYDNNDFITTLDNETDFEFNLDDLTPESTVGDVINLMERKMIEKNTQRVQEENPIPSPEEAKQQEEAEREASKDDSIIEQSATTQVLAGPDETTGKLPSEIGLDNSNPDSTTSSENSDDESSEDDEEEEDDDSENADDENEDDEFGDDENGDETLPVKLDEVHATLCDEVGIEENGEPADIDDHKTVESYLADSQSTIDDIVDRLSSDYEVDIEDGEIHNSTTLAQLVDIINGKRIAAE